MQSRCVSCGREQYALNVYALSHGQSGCSWCGFVPPAYTSMTEYRAAVRATKENDCAP